MAIQFDFDPETFIEVTVLRESNGVRLVEIEDGSAFGVEYSHCPGGTTASIFYSWQEAEANFERRVAELEAI